MDVFYLCDRVIQDYANYVRSFVRVRDRRIDEFVQKSLRDEVLWPQPLIQLNPRAEGATHFLEPRERGWPLSPLERSRTNQRDVGSERVKT